MNRCIALDNTQVVIVDNVDLWGDQYAVERRVWDPLGIRLTTTSAKTEEEVVAAAREASIIVYGGLYTPFTERVIQSLPNCCMIIRYGIGVDSVDVAAATQAGIIVANTAEYCVIEVADHTAALLLALARRVMALDQFVREGHWNSATTVFSDVPRLSTLTLGIVGFGRIGRQVARKMAPFFGRLLAYDPYIDRDQSRDYGVTMQSLDAVLSQSDFVTIHTPLLPETRHLIGASQLSLMKPAAFLVNTSRGPVVDEKALIRALQEKRIAGAALDVFDSEPLALDSPLRQMDNVILTPHFASYSVQSFQDLRQSVTQAVADVIQGYWPQFVVNPSVRPRVSLVKRQQGQGSV